ncbi:VOC family protein [Chitinophaga qingshengii]|uniref:VOC family protein n=1 Tax=Chitinophaga qingshengii TaxID=1569794 RepID=A0ABR7TMS6_9BACT|nr:VOC family protein [Chitinophaga qingshengii]MBC9931787.1 VOC family protein [Chitinophaga qingshengii]
MKIPAGHHTVMPYLMLDNAAGFLTFAQQVFQAKLSHHSLHDDGMVRHAELQIGDSTLMISSGRDPWKPQPGQLFIYVEDADASYQAALDHGATVVMEVADQSYGRSGGVKDPCGNTWWITSVK